MPRGKRIVVFLPHPTQPQPRPFDLADLDAQPPLDSLPRWEVLYKHQRDLQVVRNAVATT